VAVIQLPAASGQLPAASAQIAADEPSSVRLKADATRTAIEPRTAIDPRTANREPRIATESRTANREPRIPASWPAALFALWLIGAGAILVRLLLGLLAVQWMSRRTERVNDAPWLPQARALAAELGISRITFLRSGRAAMPMAWGIFRPAVLMPADADHWPAERLRIVLLHELAHVKRRDCLTHVLAQIACAAYWFNPLAWIAARHVRTERERACDDLVLACGTRGSDYADQLIEVARVMRAGRFPAVLAGASLAMAHR
jgi:beta-lactamase regulating signal transducer with metallopeptidase domain